MSRPWTDCPITRSCVPSDGTVVVVDVDVEVVVDDDVDVVVDVVVDVDVLGGGVVVVAADVVASMPGAVVEAVSASEEQARTN